MLEVKNNNRLPPEENNYQNEGEEDNFQKVSFSIDNTYTSDEFPNLISDCIKVKDNFFTVDFDKKLLVLDSKFNKVGEQEFNNILMKIEAIGEEVYAIAKSK